MFGLGNSSYVASFNGMGRCAQGNYLLPVSHSVAGGQRSGWKHSEHN